MRTFGEGGRRGFGRVIRSWAHDALRKFNSGEGGHFQPAFFAFGLGLRCFWCRLDAFRVGWAFGAARWLEPLGCWSAFGASGRSGPLGSGPVRARGRAQGSRLASGLVGAWGRMPPSERAKGRSYGARTSTIRPRRPTFRAFQAEAGGFEEARPFGRRSAPTSPARAPAPNRRVGGLGWGAMGRVAVAAAFRRALGARVGRFAPCLAVRGWFDRASAKDGHCVPCFALPVGFRARPRRTGALLRSSSFIARARSRSAGASRSASLG